MFYCLKINEIGSSIYFEDKWEKSDGSKNIYLLPTLIFEEE